MVDRDVGQPVEHGAERRAADAAGGPRAPPRRPAEVQQRPVHRDAEQRVPQQQPVAAFEISVGAGADRPFDHREIGARGGIDVERGRGACGKHGDGHVYSPVDPSLARRRQFARWLRRTDKRQGCGCRVPRLSPGPCSISARRWSPRPLAAPPVIRREDYQAPDWLVPEVELAFALDPARTVVTARLTVTRNGAHDRPLRLDGEELELLALRVDGEAREPRYRRTGGWSSICRATRRWSRPKSRSRPRSNSQLMGLYASGGILCTQCEAEGFRRITFFPDRPDVLSRYRVRMEADKARFPVLLANGNPVEQRRRRRRPAFRACGTTPSPSPATCSRWSRATSQCNCRPLHHDERARGRARHLGARGRSAQDRSYAMAGAEGQRWRGTSETYGREYDLDLFNIVAVSDFNFGAMENKGLNIFNIALRAGRPRDRDRRRLSTRSRRSSRTNISTIGRATGSPAATGSSCRLKEGLTVFRDQGFIGRHGLARRSSGSRRCGRCARRSSRRMRARWPIRSGRTAISRSPISTPRRSTTRAPR